VEREKNQREERDEDEKVRASYSIMGIGCKIIFNSELHQFKIRKNFACRLDKEAVECQYADQLRREEEDLRNLENYYCGVDNAERKRMDEKMLEKKKGFLQKPG